MVSSEKQWAVVKYLPEPLDAISVDLDFGAPGGPVKFGLGPAEAKELRDALDAALFERPGPVHKRRKL